MRPHDHYYHVQGREGQRRESVDITRLLVCVVGVIVGGVRHRPRDEARGAALGAERRNVSPCVPSLGGCGGTGPKTEAGLPCIAQGDSKNSGPERPRGIVAHRVGCVGGRGLLVVRIGPLGSRKRRCSWLFLMRRPYRR